jgi:hypothetical protein
MAMMPVDGTRLQEAWVMTAFWDYAMHDQAALEVVRSALAEWRQQATMYLLQARAVGEITPGIADDEFVDNLLTMIMGLQLAVDSTITDVAKARTPAGLLTQIGSAVASVRA